MKYTVEEVRNAARLLDGLSRRMLTDYAEHIEADDCTAKDAEIKRLQSRLAAANALLRKCRDEFAGLPHSLGYDFTHLPEIDAHLQGDGDE